jgi:hypothetical protein
MSRKMGPQVLEGGARANRRIADQTSTAVDDMRRRNSSRFAYRNVMALSAFGAVTAMLAVFFFQPSSPVITEIKLNGCGGEPHLRGPSQTKEGDQWIFDIYLDKHSLLAKYAGRSPPDRNPSEESKSARIESYACDDGNFTMTEAESSDHMDCTYYGKIIGMKISGAFYCPISVGGSPIGEFHFEFQAR